MKFLPLLSLFCGGGKHTIPLLLLIYSSYPDKLFLRTFAISQFFIILYNAYACDVDDRSEVTSSAMLRERQIILIRCHQGAEFKASVRHQRIISLDTELLFS